MTHHIHIPAYPLNQFISVFVYYKGFVAAHSIDRYLPNGNTEILINLSDTPQYIYDNATLQPSQAFKKVWISGLRNQFITIPSGTGSGMFIIEFKKGMVHPFLGMPLSEVTDKVVEGDLILAPVFTQLREQLLEQTSVAAKFATVENKLLAWFKGKLAVNPFIDFAINSVVNSPGMLTIKNIADKTGYSSKHFIKLFTDNVGVTPKAFLRIIRFQKAISEIETRGNTNWTAIAQECGYYAQAHFITNFKEFSGFTPVDYMRQRGDFTNYIPVG